MKIMDEILENIKDDLVKRIIKSAKSSSHTLYLNQANVYKCKLCGEISIYFTGDTIYEHCNCYGKYEIIGEKEFVGTIDCCPTILDIYSELRKVLDDPEFLKEIQLKVRFR